MKKSVKKIGDHLQLAISHFPFSQTITLNKLNQLTVEFHLKKEYKSVYFKKKIACGAIFPPVAGFLNVVLFEQNNNFFLNVRILIFQNLGSLCYNDGNFQNIKNTVTI
jgi:hypothetical protein